MAVGAEATNPVKTVLVITVGFGILFLLTKHNWLLYVSLSVGALGALSNFLAVKMDWIWTKIGWVLSKIVPNILMTLVFYLILTPTAFLSRLFGKHDPMDLKNHATSLFKAKGATYSRESFEKPW